MWQLAVVVLALGGVLVGLYWAWAWWAIAVWLGLVIAGSWYELGPTAVTVALVSASLVPLLVVPLIGGAIADAHDRRTIVLSTEIGMAAVAALLLVNSTLGEPRVWALFVLELWQRTFVDSAPPSHAPLAGSRAVAEETTVGALS